jgi:hypothetical protein
VVVITLEVMILEQVMAASLVILVPLIETIIFQVEAAEVLPLILLFPEHKVAVVVPVDLMDILANKLVLVAGVQVIWVEAEV